MKLNQVSVAMPDLDKGWDFYCALGLEPIVDSRPNYVRFLCPDGGSTFSLYQGEAVSNGTTIYFECEDLDSVFEKVTAAGIEFLHLPRDEPWLWRQAELLDPAGNRLTLYYAGDNRINPPWRIGRE